VDDRSGLITERRNERSLRLDRLTIAQAFDLMSREDTTVARAVASARQSICQAIELVVDAFRADGRLIYVGAGTSGRLGVLDAAECPPTFLSDPAMVQGVIAGGTEALTRSIEGAEDHEEDGQRAIDARDVGPRDVVLAIASGGTTPFVHGALRRARARGARTVFLACVPEDQVADEADVSIRVLTGPEVVTGSTRLKAGTATKLVLNMITTIAMVRIGKVYENLMVDVNTTANAKLLDRGIRMVHTITHLPRDASERLLKAAGGHVKTALVMHARNVDRAEAERLLREVRGQVGRVIDPG
jgi:N-acetylmuramic acid 6-phosphate etherase